MDLNNLDTYDYVVMWGAGRMCNGIMVSSE